MKLPNKISIQYIYTYIIYMKLPKISIHIYISMIYMKLPNKISIHIYIYNIYEITEQVYQYIYIHI